MRYQKIQPRDIEALTFLYKHRFLTGELFRFLPLTTGYFPSQQMANKRIKRLIEEDFIKPFLVVGIPSRVLRLRKKALHYVADWLQKSVDELEWNPHQKEPTGYVFLRHFLLNNKFRIALERACNSSEIELVDYVPEHIGKRHDSGRITELLSDRLEDAVLENRTVHHTPDAVFALERDGKAELFFVEIDRGTERQYQNPDRPYYRMIRFYLSYMKTGKYKAYNEVLNSSFSRFRVLIVTRSDKRLQNMREAMNILPVEFKNMKRHIWFSIFNEQTELEVFTESLFSPQWRSLDVKDEGIYRIG